jgi:hypothetical protein
MIDQLMGSLLDYSALGLFAIYLIWQGIQSSKKHDKLLSDFTSELDDLRDRREKELADLRDRYQAVIEDINSHRDSLTDGIDRKLKGVFAGLNKLQSTLDHVAIQVEDIRTEEKIRRAAELRGGD